MNTAGTVSCRHLLYAVHDSCRKKAKAVWWKDLRSITQGQFYFCRANLGPVFCVENNEEKKKCKFYLVMLI